HRWRRPPGGEDAPDPGGDRRRLSLDMEGAAHLGGGSFLPGPSSAGQPSTITFARIQGWGEQKYSNSPGWSNVYDQLSPASSRPESKEPSAAVTVGIIWSSLVQVTVVPTGTRRTLTE